MRDAAVVIRGAQGPNPIGGDMGEVSPPLDPAGHTALIRANPTCTILQRAGRRRGGGGTRYFF